MALPYYPRYPRDFIDGTAMMSFEVKGAYSILLDIIYLQDGACPDNDRYISGLLGCSIRKWNALKNELIALEKIYIVDGKICNFRADKELKTSRQFQETQRKNRSKLKDNSEINHTKPKDKIAENDCNTNKNNELREPWCDQTETETETYIENIIKEINFSPFFKAIEMAAKFELFYSKYPRKKSRNQAIKTFAKIGSQHGFKRIMAALAADIAEWEAEKRNLKYIPHPSSWLNDTDFTEVVRLDAPQEKPKVSIEAVRLALSKVSSSQDWQHDWFGLSHEEARSLVTEKKFEVVAA